MERIFLIVLDSVGIGGAVDAADFGDEGANTLRSACQIGGAELKNLCRMGLGNIDGIDFLEKSGSPVASYGRLSEASAGKDTTVGHWEIAGHISKEPLMTFPDGFPKEFLDEFSKKVGRGILCNKPYSGTEVIKDFGREHIASGDLIVYTSADSVLQIAAHKSVVSLEQLYSICKTAREMLTGKLSVGRVIARPFEGEYPDFKRSVGRHDYSIEPPVIMMPDIIKANGLSSIAVGKIADIFNNRGFTEAIPTVSNKDGMEKTIEIAKKNFKGLCFVNLVDFDSLWGHRRDPKGYADGLTEFDRWLPRLTEFLSQNDLLIITADHGCDPCFTKTTDHTREDVPIIIYSKGLKSENIGKRNSFSDIAATVYSLLDIDATSCGRAIKLKIKGKF